MPLFDYLCRDCGKISEILVSLNDDSPVCSSCGSNNVKKLLSAPSSMTGSTSSHSGLPGPGDTTCCGSSPGHGSCAGPGSCCGKGPF